MKKFSNPVTAAVELTNVGNEVVAVKFGTSLRLNALDVSTIGSRVLHELLPDYALFRSLYDGGFVVLSADDDKYVSNLCVASGSAVLDFTLPLELEDGAVHDVCFHLEKSDALRRDYVLRDTRTLVLRGTVTIDVDCGDEEESE